MRIKIKIIIVFISMIHLYFLWFEMFTLTSRGPKIFRKFPKDLFSQTKSMAANQGLYNGFLAAGLLWTFFIENMLNILTSKAGLTRQIFSVLFVYMQINSNSSIKVAKN